MHFLRADPAFFACLSPKQVAVKWLCTVACYLRKIDFYMNQEAMQVIVYKILKYCMYLGDHFIPIYVLSKRVKN
jgi:hypothetical protein